MPFDGTVYEGRGRSLDKTDRVIDLLSDETRWCKRKLQTPDGRHCIAGAMIAVGATAEIKNAIVLAIEQVTGDHYRRIETFNDHPLTTHALVLSVLRQARGNIAARQICSRIARLRRDSTWELGGHGCFGAFAKPRE